MKAYHLTKKALTDMKFIPQIPSNTLEEEDKSIKRVCFCVSINGCLTAIDALGFKEKLYVYEADIEPYHPTDEQVTDVFLTGEVWSLKVIDNMKLIGWVFINGYIGCQIKGSVNNQYSYEFIKKEGH